MEAIEKLRVECLVPAQTFETLWAYYLQSSGQLYGEHCRDSALSFLQAGDAIVWASRMASCANANEIVVNNLLFEALRSTRRVQFQERAGKTKSGEGFLARVLLLPNVKAAE